MFVLYITLFVLGVILGILSFAAFVIYILSMFECSELLLISCVLGLLAIGPSYGAESIKRVNTETTIEIVDLEIKKLDMTSDGCYIIAGEYIIKVSTEKYIKFNEGDIITVEVITDTVFGDTLEPKAQLID